MYDEACGEIETAHPGYLGSQDTFYVGNLKGVGRIYQQTFVDTYSKVAHCKLYVTKTPITAADLLNDRVLPFYASPHALRENCQEERVTGVYQVRIHVAHPPSSLFPFGPILSVLALPHFSQKP